MIKQHSSRISLATLILCICLGSLVILPMLNILGVSASEIYEVDPENYILLEQVELDEEIFIVMIISTAIADQFISKFKSMGLNFRAAYLSPVSPPPKYS